jgi:erythromycin esterase-like protein
MFDRLAEHRIVLLGESTHGTSEFYRARAAVTKRLVEAHGFRIVAVEADWPDAAIVDRFVCDRPHPQKEPVAFQRFPRWMWRNRETSELLTWLKGFNIGRAEADRCRFRGLDIYNMHGAIDAVITYLEKIDPRAAAVARERYGCLTPWQNEPSTYGRAVLTKAYKACEDAVIQQCRDLLARRLDYESADVGAFFDAQQNARLVAAAEHYYRIMYYGNASAWNLRDRQMFDTLERLLGAKEKAVVWAHNSHVADARHTEMGASRDELSLGQLCREGHGAECAIVGFGSYEGTVTAAHDWNRPSETMSVAPAHSASYERIFHDAGVSPALFDFIADEALKSELSTSRLQRFIGVVYRRETELRSHYMEVALPLAFDAFVWFDRSEAITPIDGDGVRRGVPDTFPFGL